MSVEFKEARREAIPLLIGVAGGTGAGKTWSAMALARGLSGERRFAVIDSENGRAKHYADEFAFDSADITAPFRPETYADAIEAADKAGYPVIVVDSMSHEWAGDGGLLDWHEEEMGGNNSKKLSAWIKPKMAHRKMVTRLLQVRAHVILAFRAQEAVEVKRDANGRMEIVPKETLTGLDGWVPITERNLPFELTLSVLLTADRPGYPKPIKLPEKLRAFVPLDRPLDESVGQALGEWAAGGSDTGDLVQILTGLCRQLDVDVPALEGRDAAWLRRQIANAEQALAEKKAPERSPDPDLSGAAGEGNDPGSGATEVGASSSSISPDRPSPEAPAPTQDQPPVADETAGSTEEPSTDPAADREGAGNPAQHDPPQPGFPPSELAPMTADEAHLFVVPDTPKRSSQKNLYAGKALVDVADAEWVAWALDIGPDRWDDGFYRALQVRENELRVTA